MEDFASGSTARTAARRYWVKRKTAAGFFCRLRESIVLAPEAESEALFGGQRKGRRGRGAAGKVPVSGLLQRAGKVYTRIIPDASSDTPMPIIEGKVMPDSIVCCEGRKGCNALAVSDFPPLRINHCERFADDHNHINGMANFWSRARRHMRRFNAIPKARFGLYLQECEWRFFNNSDAAIRSAHETLGQTTHQVVIWGSP